MSSVPSFSLPLPPGVTLHTTLGMTFVAIVLSSIFYGVTLLQTLIYFGMYTNDRISFKVLVMTLWALDTLSMALLAHAGYTYLVTFFANPVAALSMVWSMAVGPVVSGTISFIVHLFLAYRIRQLGRATLWSVISWIASDTPILPMQIVLATADLGFSAYSYAALKSGEVSHFFGTEQSGIDTNHTTPSLRWVAIICPSLAIALDLMIALTICYQLYQQRSSVKSTSTEGLINTLSLYVITSGTITTFVFLLFCHGVEELNMIFGPRR
ncbi:hypothetical protein V5O48_017100 [Marasmius crinis-equi]|uniref:DUF6534 domain-containing protein n=1 Tax=Marasmius crinis-equi TaxID=585013 RepID=A0ABR3EPY5_9AGAR